MGEPCAQAVELKEHLAAVEVREPGELMELGAHLEALEPCAHAVEPKELGGHGDQEALELLPQAQVVEPKAHGGHGDQEVLELWGQAVEPKEPGDQEALELCAQAVKPKELLVLKAEPGELQFNQALDLPMLRNYASVFPSYH